MILHWKVFKERFSFYNHDNRKDINNMTDKDKNKLDLYGDENRQEPRDICANLWTHACGQWPVPRDLSHHDFDNHHKLLISILNMFQQFDLSTPYHPEQKGHK